MGNQHRATQNLKMAQNTMTLLSVKFEKAKASKTSEPALNQKSFDVYTLKNELGIIHLIFTNYCAVGPEPAVSVVLPLLYVHI